VVVVAVVEVAVAVVVAVVVAEVMSDWSGEDTLWAVVRPSHTDKAKACARPVCLGDFLWISGLEAASSPEFISTHSITHIVNCGDDSTRGFVPPTVKYLQLNAEDDPEYNILRHRGVVWAFLNDARFSGGVALVHCRSGCNRSVSVGLAYMHERTETPLETLAQQVAEARPCLVNAAFRRRLLAWSAARAGALRGLVDATAALAASTGTLGGLLGP
jgi:protein-tyrosine phosphatase